MKMILPDPLKQFWSVLPAIADMPNYSTKTDAGFASLKHVRERLFESPKLRDPKKLLDIARPLTSRMTQLRPSPWKRFESYLPIKDSLIMCLISFTDFMLLHVIIVWLFHHYKHRQPNTRLSCGLFAPESLKKRHATASTKQPQHIVMP